MSRSRFISTLPRRAITVLIQGYRYGISPMLPSRCRFAPTCSEYALDAVREYGAAKGVGLALKRLVRCHPWGGSGYDPVPNRNHTDHAQRHGHGHGTPGLEI